MKGDYDEAADFFERSGRSFGEALSLNSCYVLIDIGA